MTRFSRFSAFSAILSLSAWSPAAAADDSAPREAKTAASGAAALHLPEVTEARLDNGLAVVLEENHSSPFVAMIVRYDAGSRDEPPGKEGAAYITQRMTTLGTKHVPAGGYEATLDRIGAIDRGWQSSLDAIAQWVTVPSNAVDSVLWLWSDQMGFFAPDDVKALTEARATNARVRDDAVTSVSNGAVHEMVEGALFPEGHPYHSAPIATGSNGGVSLDDVRAFHERNMAPNTAVLVLVGDFQTASMLERIRTYFAPIAKAAERGAGMVAPAQLEGETRLDVAANVTNPEVWIDWRTPPFFAAGDAELDVGARAMTGLRVATLRWALVDKLQCATRVTSRQMSHALGSDFRITATVAPGHSPDEVIAGIDRVLDTLRKGGLNDESFAGARSSVIVPYIHTLDRAARRASVYAGLVGMRRDPKWIAGDVGRYDAVTAAEVSATMARWLTKRHRVVTVITPDASAPKCGVLRATRGAK